MRARMNQAIAKAIADEMEADASVILMGEDVAVAEGPFKTSEGLLQRFGPERVRDTPISETGFLGAALGAAMCGLRPVVEIMFIEFLGVALDQLVTEAAMMHYLSGGRYRVPLVVRASVGAGLGFGCQHSQTLERWLVGTPGLKVAVASGARSAYALTRAAIRDDNPVVVLEPRALYGEREDFEPDDPLPELGSAEVRSEGEDVTIVALGQTVNAALRAAEAASCSAQVIDLRTLVPWDRATVLEAVRRTGRLALVEENQRSGGWGADIAAEVSERLFGVLRAPVLRITAPDVPVPFGAELEQRFVPSAAYIADQLGAWMQTGQVPAPWWAVSA
ncbi:MAG TPA: transketolase C-terminal domain-containing protein [Acidimicrobiales bacterium]|nr:transketolase C-terminal domain-containing protein [Acidimicrobiales bacterium]